VIIPTLNREKVLLGTIESLLQQEMCATEILVIDQTDRHEPATEEQLAVWAREGDIRWVRLDAPNLPRAMNTGLESATCPLALFLDDDILAGEHLISAHLDAYRAFPEAVAVVGQVLQPGQSAREARMDGERSGLGADLLFPFWSSRGDWVCNAMAGNLSVRREAALAVGGLDENFTGVAFRIETDFARRLIAAGGKIRFHPEASIRHLRHPSGGTRSHTVDDAGYSARQGFGDFYFAFVHGTGAELRRYIRERFHRELRTGHYLRHPWLIPARLWTECRALVLGWRMARRKTARA